MTMVMSDDEIRVSYKQAKDRAAQIDVLADLNAVKKEDMEEKLEALGLEMPVKKPHKGGAKKKPPIDELRAMELYSKGMSDLDIAECLGEPISRIMAWRRRMRLKVNKGQNDLPLCEQETTPPALRATSPDLSPNGDKGRQEKEEGAMRETGGTTPPALRATSPDLSPNGDKGRQEKEEGTASHDKGRQEGRISAETLAGILQRVAEGYPTDSVRICAEGQHGLVREVSVKVDYGADGKVREVEVWLWTD